MSNAHPKKAVASVYLLGLAQGIAFTTIPAAGNFLTSGKGFGFSVSQYGALFFPMILGAIMAAFFGGVLAKRYSLKAVLLTAVLFNVAAMGLIAAGQTVLHTPTASYPLLMLAMAFLGSGFGATITALNPFAVSFFPLRSDSALTALHACLGIGTAVGPLLLNLFFSIGVWWGDPLAVALCFGGLFLAANRYLPYDVALDEGSTASSSAPFPWVFVWIALFYGITETAFGNWASIFLHQEKDLTQVDANYALSVFWGAVTCGRIAATGLSLKVPSVWIYRALPVLILLGIWAIEAIIGIESAVLAFALAGLGCSAFLPLTIDFGVKRYLANPPFISGALIASYMAGYGISAQGIGLWHEIEGVSFHTVYLWLAVLVLFLTVLSASASRPERA